MFSLCESLGPRPAESLGFLQFGKRIFHVLVLVQRQLTFFLEDFEATLKLALLALAVSSPLPHSLWIEQPRLRIEAQRMGGTEFCCWLADTVGAGFYQIRMALVGR